MQTPLLLIEVLNESPPALLHLSETALEAEPVRDDPLVLLQDLLLLLLLLL